MKQAKVEIMVCDGRSKLTLPSGMENDEVIRAISIIYLHAKQQLETFSRELGLDVIKLAEEKIKPRTL